MTVLTERILNLDGTPVTDYSDPNRKVKWFKNDIYGDPVYGGLRTIAHLDATSLAALEEFGHELEVLQGAYNTDVEASAGTHDLDRALDVFIPTADWWAAQWFLRLHGWAAWYRYPPLFGSHIHMITLGGTGPVGYLIPGQIADYYAHKTGLSGHAADTSQHPADIDSTIFDFQEWEREMEDAMGVQLDDDIYRDDRTVTVRGVLQRIDKFLQTNADRQRALLDALAAIRAAVDGPDLDRAKVRKMLDGLERRIVAELAEPEQPVETGAPS